MPIRAVIFDLGGVVVSSPLEAIREYEKTQGLPPNYLNVAIQARGSSGAFQRFERGELSLSEFIPAFSADLSCPENVDHYERFLAAKSLKPLSTSHVETLRNLHVDGNVMFQLIMKASDTINPLMEEAIRRLKGHYKVAALTNNFALPEESISPAQQNLNSLFDEVFESSKIGLRKPDPKIYLHVCKALGVLPEECVFLDDIAVNLKSAKDLGMKTIRVYVGKVLEALSELESQVGIKLVTKSKL
ncbi:hypothetical protein HDU79_007084 [Rhizoclosmatium sp. JEL0117]|nr:hypothetical protein HDU79_007084 [Rhizoclosmatium sp. JEL0117]